jgi:glutamyl-tRNA reductase
MPVLSTYHAEHILSRFHLCGISHQKADVTVRSLFHINDETKKIMLQMAKDAGIRSLLILSTCNRTEIYGYVPDVCVLKHLFIACKQIDADLLHEKVYIKSGGVALQHLFLVAAGLDSQILGDYEIVSQLKLAVAVSQQAVMIGPVMHRTINYSLQASKKIKTNTAISSGTTSVSFAAIEWLRNNTSLNGKKIALLGLGKFGAVIGKHLKHYFSDTAVTVCNRTDEKAKTFAAENQFQFVAYAEVAQLVNESDVIIVSTQSATPTVLPFFLKLNKQRIFLDLSVPLNVDAAIKAIELQQVVDVDTISVLLNKSLQKRRLEIPKALQIVDEVKKEFYTWIATYTHTHIIKEAKNKLYALTKSLQCCEMANSIGYNEFEPVDEQIIKRTISRLAVNLRTNTEKGCQFIKAYNHFLNQQKND